MKRTSLISACLLVVVLFTANTAFTQTNAEYKAKIEKINKTMTKDMLSGNTESCMALYTSDAISLPSYEPMREGIDAIRKSGEDMKKAGMKFNSFEPTTLKVLVNGNWITEIGTYKISMSIPGMEKPMDDHGKYLTVWEKQKDGSLKIKIETWNTDVNPMTMMGGMEQTKN
jgi:ketosteroid isomerase-like protein